MGAPDSGNLSLGFEEALYESFLRDPASVPTDWRRHFESLPRPSRSIEPSLSPTSVFNPPGDGVAASAPTSSTDSILRAYREYGHLAASLDPLGRPRPGSPNLVVDSAHAELIDRLRRTYGGSIGVQYHHIDDRAVQAWIEERMEAPRTPLTRDEQLRILTRLTDGELFEEFVQKKFVGAKSFSLEGAETLLPLLDLVFERAGEHAIDEIVIGMAHRGRLNVLANLMGKRTRDIFREFVDREPTRNLGRGDVKYHLGYSNDWITSTRKGIHLSLCFNPSHLEVVDPIVMGRLRAKQDRAGDPARGMALLIHGDAAFAGEGIIQEILNISGLPAYDTAGVLHVVINNQLGFTTPPEQSRSTTYCTDVAKMLPIPIFHVNGEDPEAVAHVVRTAMDFRAAFKRDVIIDMYAYRRRGHNEADEPAFTQPLLYRDIEKRKPVRAAFADRLISLGVTKAEADEIVDRRRKHLEEEHDVAKARDYTVRQTLSPGVWRGCIGGSETSAVEAETGVPRARLSDLLTKLTALPGSFHPHPKIVKLLESRRAMARGEKPLDWAAGEALAFATLATEKWRVRITGQDAERGTFSHRHAVLHDVENGATHVPLAHLAPNQQSVFIANSALSEMGVLGFEYGYSLDTPDGLVIWEAQFGDFVNVAQVMIDQFIASAEEKWQRLSSLVLLLPHGYEGQGPEHSSARVERFLQLAAEDNLQIVNATTPAQLFHVLRRQVTRTWRKPLVVFSPKSLLRHAEAVSPFEEFETGTFRRIIADPVKKPERILLCTGKIYYDLAAQRRELKRDDVAIVRVEQLYPLRDETIAEALAGTPDYTRITWVQEEPANQGAWPYLRARFGTSLAGRPFDGISRRAASSPATGSPAAHKYEQKQILDKAFA